MFRSSKEAKISIEKRKEIVHYFEMNGNGNKRRRLEQEFEKVTQARPKAPNKVMLIHGVDHTPAVQGKVDFSKLRAKQHKPAIVEELHLRERTASLNDKWNDLRQKMKDAEGIDNDEKKLWFEPRTDTLKAFLNGDAE